MFILNHTVSINSLLRLVFGAAQGLRHAKHSYQTELCKGSKLYSQELGSQERAQGSSMNRPSRGKV